MKDEKNEISTRAADAAVIASLEREGADLSNLFTRDILLMHTMVNGAMHVRNIHHLAAHLQKGDLLKLVLEPDNQADPMAVLVRTAENRKIGYIPRNKNEVIFHLLDAGKQLYAVVSGGTIAEKLKKKEPWVEIFIDVYMKD